MLPIAILVGGLGTRISPLTKEKPKAMIDILGRPFIEWQLDLLAEKGIHEVVLCVGHKSKIIEDFVGDGSKFGIKVKYSHDGLTPLGTGGAIRKALPLLGNSFMVLYGDSYLPVDYSSIEEKFYKIGKPALMTVYKNDGAYDLSNVDFKENEVKHYCKGGHNLEMKYIDYGLSFFTSSIFEVYPENLVLDLSQVVSNLSNSHLLAGHEVQERFFEVGSTRGIEDFTNHIKGSNYVF